MGLPQTNINGNRYSFTSISVSMGVVDIPKGAFKSWNYEAAQDPGNVQGNQVTIVGRTSGYGLGNGSFEMLDAEFDAFVAAITSGGTLPIMSVDFDVTLNYSVNDVDVRTDVLRGVRITKISSQNQQGQDASYKQCDVNIARIRLNGVDAFGDPAI